MDIQYVDYYETIPVFDSLVEIAPDDLVFKPVMNSNVCIPDLNEEAIKRFRGEFVDKTCVSDINVYEVKQHPDDITFGCVEDYLNYCRSYKEFIV